MASNLGEFRSQNLGQDFVFESDPKSLQRILANEELSPKSVLALRLSTKLAAQTLSPLKSASKNVKANLGNYDIFESNDGEYFFKPKPFDSVKANLFGSAKKMKARQRAMGTGIITALPKRWGIASDDDNVDRKAMTGKKTTKSSKDHSRRSCMPDIAMQNAKSGARLIPMPPPRQSISERKAVPGIDRVPRKVANIRKELDFAKMDDEKENVGQESASFEFAKPKVVPQQKGKPNGDDAKPEEEKRSLAKTIMMRESLAGLPRASLSGLFRQSLSIAELDRMFEDDSTMSFEDLERRLKTPTNKKTKSCRPIEKSDGQTEPLVSPEHDEEADNSEISARKGEEEQNSEVEENPKEEESDLDDTAVEKVEIFEYEIDDEDDEDEVEAILLQKSSSLTDLSSESPDVVAVSKSMSIPDLSTLSVTEESGETSSELIRLAVKDLEEHRREQAAMEVTIQKLLEKKRKRMEDFRAVWGMSPRSLNQKRTVKTAINVQDVGFAPTSENAGPKSSEKLEKQENLDCSPAEHEDKLADPGVKMFQEYVDANFSLVSHNFSGIDIPMEPTLTSIDEILIDPIMEAGPNLNILGDSDFNNMSLDDNNRNNLRYIHSESDLNTPEVTISRESPDKTNAEDHDPINELAGFGSLFAAAKALKMEMAKEQKKRSKCVRFSSATPQREESFDEEETRVQVNIGGISFNEARVTKAPVHTPVPKGAMFKMADFPPGEESSDEFLGRFAKTPPLPTPMALRDISMRAQESLAGLYADEDTDESKNQLRPTVLFTDVDASPEESVH